MEFWHLKCQKNDSIIALSSIKRICFSHKENIQRVLKKFLSKEAFKVI